MRCARVAGACVSAFGFGFSVLGFFAAAMS